MKNLTVYNTVQGPPSYKRIQNSTNRFTRTERINALGTLTNPRDVTSFNFCTTSLSRESVNGDSLMQTLYNGCSFIHSFIQSSICPECTKATITNDVNKDLTLKAKARTKDLSCI